MKYNFPLGSFVEIKHSIYKNAEIIEHRGPLGPKGMMVYRVLIQAHPDDRIIEVLENQIKAKQ